MTIAYDNDSYLSTLVWTGPDFIRGVATTTFGWNGPAESPTTVETLAADLVTAFTDHLDVLFDTDTSLSIVRVESANFSIEMSAAVPGATSIASAAPQVAALLTKSATGKGPRNRGRNFFPQVLSTINTSEAGIITQGRLDQLNAAWQSFLVAVEAGGGGRVLSIPQSDEPNQASQPILPWPEVVSSGFAARIATQRRRVRR